MKSVLFRTVIALAAVSSLAACGSMSPQQRNTVTGAVIGGAAGNLIGGDTASTLGGAALGGVIGSQVERY